MRNARRARTLSVVIAVAIGAPLVVPAPAAAAPAAGFEDRRVASVPAPTALAFTPDGRLLIAGQHGRLWVHTEGDAEPSLVLDIENRVCHDRDQGLLSLTIGPTFATNGFVYVSYTSNKSGDCSDTATERRVNRVSRFTMAEDGSIDEASEHVLFDNIPAPDEGLHSNGDLAFGPDGYLYISLGDGSCDPRGDSGCQTRNDAARDLSLPLGKILRIAPDGSTPPDNPFVGPDSVPCRHTGTADEGSVCSEIYAYGLRNPFRMAFDPETGRLLINDVGYASWEEISVGAPGADYGWNGREGQCKNDVGGTMSVTDCGTEPPRMTNPILQYGRDDGCGSITGGAFVPGGVWPAAYDGDYLFSDLVCSKIFRLVEDGVPASRGDLTDVVGFPVDLAFGPLGDTQALYYATRIPEEVRVISYVGDENRAPVARATASRNAGKLPLSVNFDGSDSSDPDLDDLVYEWNFGDGSSPSSEPSPEHAYITPGTYTAELRVSDPEGASDAMSIRIDAGNEAPVADIEVPGNGARYRLGEPIALEGTAHDAEDGALPDDSLTWSVLLHHNAHTHAYLPETRVPGVGFVTPRHDDNSAASKIFLEVRLTATDEGGVSTTVTRDLHPVETTEITRGPSGTVPTDAADLEFIGKDYNATFRCSLDDTPMEPCSSPLRLEELSDGPHELEVRGADREGNLDPSSAKRSWIVDTTPPETILSSATGGVVSSREATFEFSAPGGDAVAFRCSVDGGLWAPCTSPVRLSALGESQHTFGVTALDAVGNVDKSPAGRSWIVDATPPETSISSGPEGTTPARRATFTLSASDKTDTSFLCALDGAPASPCTATPAYGELADGEHRLVVTARDAAGNVDPTPATRTWTIDSTAPAPPTMVIGGGRRFQTSETFPVEWSGPSATYDVEQVARPWNDAAFDWVTLLAGTTSTNQEIESEPGTTYCFHARALDPTGNASSWSDHGCTTAALDDDAFDGGSTGTWAQEENDKHYGRRALVSYKKGSSLRVPVGGALHAALVVERCPMCGAIAVFAEDGTSMTLVRRITLYRPSETPRALVPIKLPGDAGREQDLVVKVVSARRRVAVDGIALDRLDL